MKIWFNVFARTLIDQGYSEEVYSDKYENIRSFIRTGNPPIPISIVVDQQFVSAEQGEYEWGAPVHVICWQISEGVAKARVQLFNNVVYDFDLGAAPNAQFDPGICGYGYVIEVRTPPVIRLQEVLASTQT